MKSPNNSGNIAPPICIHLSPPSKASGATNEFHLTELLAKEDLWHSQTTQTIAKVICDPLQADVNLCC